MKLHFLGANRQVTGSKYCLEVGGSYVLIDAGMFQERQFEPRNWEPCPIVPSKVTAMLLTHAHLDHCGLIPRFVQQGLNCPIHCTEPTAPLTEVILRDSAEIQAEDLQYKLKRLRREKRKPKYPPETLYTERDVERTLPMLTPHPYGERIDVCPGVSATFYDAGHIMGSAMIQIEATEEGVTRTILFSGDIGQWDKPIIGDPTLFRKADYVVMESTYGDGDHEKHGDIESQLADIVNQTIERGGNLVIPTFAVERAQELMYYIARLLDAGRIKPMPMFLDSPMAIDVTGIYAKFIAYHDRELTELIARHQSPLQMPGLKMCRTADESKAINFETRPSIIMASSGMCTAGRIKHHLRNNIERPESTILFVGHQAIGTLGRIILDGAPRVRIHGGEFQSLARKAQIYGFSGHADRPQLLRWLTSLETPPRRTFLAHGEESVSLGMASYIEDRINWPVQVPHYVEAIDLE